MCDAGFSVERRPRRALCGGQRREFGGMTGQRDTVVDL